MKAVPAARTRQSAGARRTLADVRERRYAACSLRRAPAAPAVIGSRRAGSAGIDLEGPEVAIAPGTCSEIGLDVAFEFSGTWRRPRRCADGSPAGRSGGGRGNPGRRPDELVRIARPPQTPDHVLRRRMRPEDFPRAICLPEGSTVPLVGLVSERLQLDAAADVFRALAAYRGTTIVVEGSCG
jgi:hypothetical protein